MEYIILIVVLIGFAGLAFYLKQPIAKDIDQIELKDVRISLLEKEAAQKDLNISNPSISNKFCILLISLRITIKSISESCSINCISLYVIIS